MANRDLDSPDGATPSAMLTRGDSSVTGAPFACVLKAWRENQAEIKGYLIHRLADPSLADVAAPMPDIAVALNYANASAVTRAFRRWSGSTPSARRDKRRPPAHY